MVAVRAIYENGTLRLLDPLDLPPGQQVILQVDPVEAEATDANKLTPEQELAILREALGDLVIWADPDYDDGNAWVEDELENIARELAGGKSLSEIIIEERHEP